MASEGCHHLASNLTMNLTLVANDVHSTIWSAAARAMRSSLAI